MHWAVQSVLLLLVALQVKHVICDGPMQTLRMVKDKAVYGKPQGLLHGLIYAFGCFVVLALWGLPWSFVAALAVLDGVLHYHLDFIKENVVKWMGWGYADSPFWWGIITDQSLHHLTSILLVWLAFTQSVA